MRCRYIFDPHVLFRIFFLTAAAVLSLGPKVQKISSLNNKALKNVGCIWCALFVIKNKLLYLSKTHSAEICEGTAAISARR